MASKATMQLRRMAKAAASVDKLRRFEWGIL
jgi:hypothetical protein